MSTHSLLELRHRLMPQLPQLPGPRAEVPATSVVGSSTEPALPLLVVQGPDRLTLTTPVVAVPGEKAGDMASRLYLRLRGRLVEAERANRNGAFWSMGDLEFGLPSVAGGPLNWLHQERKVVGALSAARLVTREAAMASAAQGPGVGAVPGPHIATEATLWRWLYPAEAAAVERAAEQRSVWLSMECVSPQVACVGDAGCGASVPYLDALRRDGAACTHMRERSAVRRFVDPTFQGAGIIVPPVTPGWANAHLDVVREAAAALAQDHCSELAAGLPAGLGDDDAVAMVAQVLAYARS